MENVDGGSISDALCPQLTDSCQTSRDAIDSNRLCSIQLESFGLSSDIGRRGWTAVAQLFL